MWKRPIRFDVNKNTSRQSNNTGGSGNCHWSHNGNCLYNFWKGTSTCTLAGRNAVQAEDTQCLSASAAVGSTDERQRMPFVERRRTGNKFCICLKHCCICYVTYAWLETLLYLLGRRCSLFYYDESQLLEHFRIQGKQCQDVITCDFKDLFFKV